MGVFAIEQSEIAFNPSQNRTSVSSSIHFNSQELESQKFGDVAKQSFACKLGISELLLGVNNYKPVHRLNKKEEKWKTIYP